MRHDAPPSKLDRTLAAGCRNGPVCRTARRRQTGLAFWLGNRFEHQLCPFCRVYERVYVREAYESDDGQPRMNGYARE